MLIATQKLRTVRGQTLTAVVIFGCYTGSARGSPGYKVPCLDVASRSPSKLPQEPRIRILPRVCRLTMILLFDLRLFLGHAFAGPGPGSLTNRATYLISL